MHGVNGKLELTGVIASLTNSRFLAITKKQVFCLWLNENVHFAHANALGTKDVNP